VIVSLQGVHRLRSVLERCKYGFCVRKECAPSFGEHGSAPPSFEQGHSQLIFKKLDAPRNRWLRPMQLAGRARHPAELGNRYEGFQLVQVHRPSEKLMQEHEIMH